MALYLVTGGGGFIGSHLVRRLLDMGESVRVVDDFSTGRLSNLEGIVDEIELLGGDIADENTARRCMAGADYVLHHAAMVSVPASVNDPLRCDRCNVRGTVNLLVAARDAGVSRFVLASSSAVYGAGDGSPSTEDRTFDPVSPYALTKLIGEQYCGLFYRLYGLETVCLRYFNVYGPRQDPASQYAAVIPRFALSMLRGEVPTVYGDGLQTRDFVHVADVVAANMKACSVPGIAGGVYNIASGRSQSVLNLVDALNRILGVSIIPRHEACAIGDVRHSSASIDRAVGRLGYAPRVGFAEGLSEVLEWLREAEPAGPAVEAPVA